MLHQPEVEAAIGGPLFWSAPDRPRSNAFIEPHVLDYSRSPLPVVTEGDAQDGSSAALERVLRALFRVRGRSEMENAVLDQVCRVTSAHEAALYRNLGSECRLCASRGVEPAEWAMFAGEVSAIAEGLSGIRPLQGGSRPENSGPDPRLAGALRWRDGHAILVLGRRAGGGEYREREIERLGAILDICAAALENASLVEHLGSLVLIDPLTGCYNRRGFDEHLKVEMVRASRYRRPISLLILDIDRFKEVNDTFGHPVGDAVLRSVGETLSAEFRTTDVVCRFGGDEFAVIFPETPKREVARLAERLRARIAGLQPDRHLPAGITASIGVAAFPEDAGDADVLLREADRALYRAKTGGRNRVVRA